MSHRRKVSLNRMPRRIRLTLLLTLAALTLAACGSRSNSTRPARTLSVELTEFAITPATVSTQVGETLTFVVTNEGVFDHDLTVANSEGEVLAHVEVKHGQTDTLDFKPSASGELLVFCSINGHAKAGMTAHLVVSPQEVSR